jgi:tetratricopeptide (TPR) repeat protein
MSQSSSVLLPLASTSRVATLADRGMSTLAREKYDAAAGLVQSKQWAAALDTLNDVIQLHSRHIDGLVLRSRVFYVLGQHDNAVADAERALRYEPDHAGALLQLAHLLLAEGQHVEALAVTEAGLQSDSSREDLLHLRALIRFVTNNFVGAAQDAAALLARAGVAVEVLRSVGRIFGSSMTALRAMHDDAALQDLHLAYPEGCAEGMPDDKLSLVNAPEWALRQLSAGQLYFDRGSVEDYQKAASIWEACRLIFALASDVDNAVFVEGKLRTVYAALGRPEQTQQLFRSWGPDRPEAVAVTELVRAGQEAHAESQFAKSVASFESAIKLHERSFDFAGIGERYCDIAEVYQSSANTALAMRNYDLGAHKAKHASDAYTELRAQNGRAMCAIQLERYDDARAALTRALELHLEAYEQRTVINAETSDRNAFVAQVSLTHATTGELCLATKQISSALEWFERARSFSLTDALGEQLGREGMHDVTCAELTVALATAGIDCLLSYHQAGPTRMHGFMLAADGAVVYRPVTWQRAYAVSPDAAALLAAKSEGKPARGVFVVNPTATLFGSTKRDDDFSSGDDDSAPAGSAPTTKQHSNSNSSLTRRRGRLRGECSAPARSGRALPRAAAHRGRAHGSVRGRTHSAARPVRRSSAPVLCGRTRRQGQAPVRPRSNRRSVLRRGAHCGSVARAARPAGWVAHAGCSQRRRRHGRGRAVQPQRRAGTRAAGKHGRKFCVPRDNRSRHVHSNTSRRAEVRAGRAWRDRPQRE